MQASTICRLPLQNESSIGLKGEGPMTILA
jgi:hypothetical protein